MSVVLTSTDLECQVRKILEQHLDLAMYRVFVFGSQASGRAHTSSDLDVGIDGPAPVPHGTMAAIAEALEALPTLRTVDVVDFRRTGAEFRAVACAHTRPLAT